ncbi:hypothetical protein ACFV9E_44570, partial [Streptomyces sp. NPDC059835]|uniref:hypothetical protein n=1 Tax=Streptomyces sp. NPDC059835 TaxID=3346967 RepID=UPI00365740E9
IVDLKDLARKTHISRDAESELVATATRPARAPEEDLDLAFPLWKARHRVLTLGEYPPHRGNRVRVRGLGRSARSHRHERTEHGQGTAGPHQGPAGALGQPSGF